MIRRHRWISAAVFIAAIPAGTLLAVAVELWWPRQGRDWWGRR